MVGRSSVFAGANPTEISKPISLVYPKSIYITGNVSLLFLPPELHHSNATGDEHPLQEAHRSPSSFLPNPPETTLQHLPTKTTISACPKTLIPVIYWNLHRSPTMSTYSPHPL